MPRIEARDTAVQENSLKEKKLPPSVDFMLLGACDLCCPFCYGPSHETPPMDTRIAKSIIRNLADNGVEHVVFTGGEPTLVKDLSQILTEAKHVGLTTVLSTNGLRLARNSELLKEIVPSLDWIGLPLDGDTPEVNGKMRVGFRLEESFQHFSTVVGLIQQIKSEYPQLKLKVGTVVARPNLEHVRGIPDVLVEHNAIPDSWKLYQISPSEYGKANYSWLQVTDEEFDRAFQEASAHARELGIPNVVRYDNLTRPGKYLFINPRGEALIVHPDDNDYRSIGNMLTDVEDVLSNWQSYVDQNLLMRNFENTYPAST